MDAGAPERPLGGLERWLGSWALRQVLVWTVVLLSSALSATIVADALESFGRPFDRGELFARRFLEWAIWGVLFEPLFQLFQWLSRHIRSRLALLAAHLLCAFLVVQGVSSFGHVLGDALGGPPPGRVFGPREEAGERPREPDGAPPPERFERRRGRGRFGSRLRTDRSFLVYLTLLGLSGGIRAFLRQRAEERRARALQRELGEARLTNLRHQIHPHFLFNSLHSVGGLIREGRKEVALSTLSDLSALLRNALDQEGRQEVSLAEQLELVERYLEIEKLRLGDRLEHAVRLDAGLSSTAVPSLVLLPVVENAIKYAVAPRAEGGQVEIEIKRDGDHASIEVLDDGPGFSPEARAALEEDEDPGVRRRIGLRNTRRRLEMLYGERGGLAVESRPGGGACVRLWVPLHHAGGES